LPFFGDCCQKEKTLVEILQGKSKTVFKYAVCLTMIEFRSIFVVSQECFFFRKVEISPSLPYKGGLWGQSDISFDLTSSIHRIKCWEGAYLSSCSLYIVVLVQTLVGSMVGHLSTYLSLLECLVVRIRTFLIKNI